MRVIGELDYELLQPVRSDTTTAASNETISPSDSYEYEVSNDLTGYSAIVVTVRVTYSASATSGVRVRWLYSPDGTNYDSPDAADNEKNYQDIYFSAGDTIQETLLIPIFMPYIKVHVYNKDTVESVTLNSMSIVLLR